MASRRSSRSRKRPARRAARSSFAWPEMPVLEQRHFDLIGLGLVALAAFFAFVFYLGWDGGKVGEAMAQGFVFLLGGVAYLVPVALFGAGAVLVLKPMLPSVRPFRSGAACLMLGLMLGLAAGAFGLGPADPPREGFFKPEYFKDHGGLVGDALFWTTRTLFQDVGTHILFVFLMLGGVLLLTGASVAGVMRATHESVTSLRRRADRGERHLGRRLLGILLRPARPGPQLLAVDLCRAGEEPLVRGPLDREDRVGDAAARLREGLLQLGLVVDVRRSRVVDPVGECGHDRRCDLLVAVLEEERRNRRLEQRGRHVPALDDAAELLTCELLAGCLGQPFAEVQLTGDGGAALA